MLPGTPRAVDDVATHPYIHLHTHSHTHILDISIRMTDDSAKSAPNATDLADTHAWPLRVKTKEKLSLLVQCWRWRVF